MQSKLYALNMNLLEIKNVTKNYAHHKALNNISLQVEEGKIFGLLGPNGAGKTSLIRIINQITAPDEGEIFLMGEKLAPRHIELIGYLPEERGLYKKMKVGEQAMYLARLKGLSKQDALDKLKYWFNKFEIQGWWDKKIEELSKGMQQKIQFVVTILHNPKLLIFDEPFSGFDPINANLLKHEILALKNNGATVIFSTHNMASVEEICDDIALINKSKKILEGSVNEIRNNYKKNIFELIYENTDIKLESIVSPSFEISNSKQCGYQTMQADIKIPDDYHSKDLLENLIKHINIKGFREILPNMNEIFIETVTKSNESE